jgi:hypothetical protein
VVKDNNLLGKMSFNEIMLELSKMERIVEKSGAEYFAAVPKKVEKIVDLFKDLIPMGQIGESSGYLICLKMHVSCFSHSHPWFLSGSHNFKEH